VKREGPVGYPANTESVAQPPDAFAPVPPNRTPDDLIEALIVRLGEVSPVWEQTFPPNPKGYAGIQKFINTYGYSIVRESLGFALDSRIVPSGKSAWPLLRALCERRTV
jgi:hypothetical protein